jgi:hypothetical protein
MDFRIGYRHRLRTVSLLRKKRLRVRACIGAAIVLAAAVTATTWNRGPSGIGAASAAAPAAHLALAGAGPAVAARPVYPYSIVPGGVATREDVQHRVETDPVVARHYASFDIRKAHAVAVTKPRAVHVSYRKGDKVYWTARTVMLAAGETLLTDGASEIRGRCGNRISDQAMLPVAMNEPTAQELDAAMTAAGDPDGGSLQDASFALDDAAPSGSATALRQFAAASQGDAAPADPYTRATMPDMPSYSTGMPGAMGMQRTSFLTVSSGPTDAMAPATEASSTVVPDTAAATPASAGASAPVLALAGTPAAGALAQAIGGNTVTGSGGAASAASAASVTAKTADTSAGTPAAAGPAASAPATPVAPVVPAVPVKALPAGEIPEPATLWLSGAALAAMVLAGRRNNRRRNG